MNDDTVLGKVAKVVDATHLVINRGVRDGVRMDGRFVVFARGEDVRDPDTGESLGALEIVRGIGRVIHVQEQMATLRSDVARESVTELDYPGNRMFGVEIAPARRVIEREIEYEEFDSPAVGDLVRELPASGGRSQRLARRTLVKK